MCSNLILGPHVWWLDNYAKFYHIRIPTEERAYLRQCRWTVCGARPLPDDCLKRAFDAEGELIPAMPDDIFEDAPAVLRFLRKFSRRPVSYVHSVTNLSRLHTFPPGPPTGSRRTPTSGEFWSDRGDVSAKKFVPTALEADDVGSDSGLLTVLLRWCNPRRDANNYGCIVADVNIFDRIMKVTFYPSHDPTYSHVAK